MKKLLIVGMIGAVALFVIAKKTHTFSYVTTLCSSITRDASDAVPTKFELERIRNEIANLDGDVSNMIRPIAEYKAEIERLRKDINKTQTTVEDRKKDLLAVVEKLEACENKGNVVLANNKRYPVEKVKAQVQRETENVKQSEKNVKTQQQVLEAKETSLKATQEQLAKVVSKKREYELRLAQLEAMDQSLQIARIGSTINIDASRTTQIEEALQSLEKRLATDREEMDLRNNPGPVNIFERQEEPVDLGNLRTYLQGGEQSEKAATNR